MLPFTSWRLVVIAFLIITGIISFFVGSPDRDAMRARDVYDTDPSCSDDLARAAAFVAMHTAPTPCRVEVVTSEGISFPSGDFGGIQEIPGFPRGIPAELTVRRRNGTTATASVAGADVRWLGPDASAGAPLRVQWFGERVVRIEARGTTYETTNTPDVVAAHAEQRAQARGKRSYPEVPVYLAILGLAAIWSIGTSLLRRGSTP